MQSPLFIGIDVAKSAVVVACANQSFPVHSVPNTEAALGKFLTSLPAGSRIAMEATGSYHQQLADLAHAKGFPVYVINPKDMRHYAKGVGSRAKTDEVDAVLIARFLSHEVSHLQVYTPPTDEQREMDTLLKRRATIIGLKTALQQSCAGMTLVGNHIADTLASFTQLLAAIDRQIAQRMNANPQRAAQFKRLQTITGIGPLTGAWLTNLLDRIAFKNSDALVAFTGMDPRSCDSGQKRGRRRLSKRGPSEGRRLLFNAGMSAAKSATWAGHYAHYRQLGWTSTEAILIIARKILRIAFSMHKNGSSFDPAFVKVPV